MIDKQRRDELWALCEKATPGPWHADGDGDIWTDAEVEHCPGMDQTLFRTVLTTRCGPDRGDAAFAAASRIAIPELLDALDEMEAELSTCRDKALEESAQEANEHQCPSYHELCDCSGDIARAIHALKGRQP